MVPFKNKRVLARQQRNQRYIIKDWGNRLAGVPAFILGNGPSLNNEPIKALEPYFTIGLNRAFYLIDPTVLFWQDIGLWNTEHHKLHNLECLKVCRDISDPRHIYYNFYLRGGPFRFDKRPHILSGRGTTGPLAVEFAVALGCKPIILLGMDCKTKDGKTDFYGNNPHWKPHTLESCRNGLIFVQGYCPVKVINCSDNDVFKTRTGLAEVLSCIDKQYAMGREKYVKMLIHNKK